MSNLLERLREWLRPEPHSASPPREIVLTEMMQAAKRAQFAEQYAEAQHLYREAQQLAEAGDAPLRSIEIRLIQADILIEMRDYAAAEALLDDLQLEIEAAQLRAPLSYVFSARGVLAQAGQQWTQARDHLEQAQRIGDMARVDGAAGRAQAHLADNYLQEGNAAYAIRLLREAIPRLQTSGDIELLPYFTMRLADALLMAGNRPEGESILRTALGLATAHQQTRPLREILIRLGDLAAEDEAYTQAREHYRQAKTLVNPDRQPDQHVHLLLACADVLLKQDDPGGALEQLDAVQPYVEAKSDPDTLRRSRTLRGMALYRLGEIDAARDLLQTEAGSDQCDVLRVLAGIHAAAGDRQQALDTLQRAIDAAKEAGNAGAHADALRDAGQLVLDDDPMAALERWSQAADLYDAAGRRASAARLYCRMATLRERTGGGGRIMRDYESALERLSSVEDARTRGDVLGRAAVAYGDDGDTASAEAFFKEAIDIAQHSGDTRAESQRRGDYGRFLALIDDPKPAITALMQARNLSEEWDDGYRAAVITDGLGLAYAALGQPEKALSYYDEALSRLDALDAEHPEARAAFQANRAETLMQLRQPDTARSAFSAAYEGAAPGNHLRTAAHALVGLAALDVQADDTNAARTKIAEAIRLAEAVGARRVVARALLLRAHLSGVTDDYERAETLIRSLNLSEGHIHWLRQVKNNQS